jgi:hypothetical protein
VALWFERDDVLSACEHHPAECHNVHFRLYRG